MKTIKSNGYNIFFTDKGAFLKELIFSDKINRFIVNKVSNESKDRDVFLIEYYGDKFILKRNREIDNRLEKKIQSFIFSSRNLKMMRILKKHEEELINVTATIHFLAEKKVFRKLVDSYIAYEYIEGAPLASIDESNKYAVANCISKLHKYHLASNDIHCGNFILDENKNLRVIDLSIKGSVLRCQANDLVLLHDKYGIKPLHRNFLYHLVSIRNKMRSSLRKIMSYR